MEHQTMAEGKYFGFHKSCIIKNSMPRPLCPSLLTNNRKDPQFYIYPFLRRNEIKIFIRFSFDLLIVIIPSSGHGDGVVLNHLERATAIVQIFLSELNFSMI